MDREAGSVAHLIPRVNVLGIGVSAINMEMAQGVIRGWIDDGAREYICVTGAHGVIESQSDPLLGRILNSSGLTTPDGMPLVWSSKYAGAFWVERVYGPDLMLRVCEDSIAREWSHFFYGAGPGVAEELSTRLRMAYPGLNIAGTHTPPFRQLTEEEVEEVASLINQSGAHIVWVGLSTPKQEKWMAQFRPLLAAPVLVGVGAAFDIHAGRTRQAPRWMQGIGLEWLFRLVVEPRRLWRRYLRVVPEFMARVMVNPPRWRV